jgi:asparagine synthase (glutamine-hydrolysing)
MCGIAGVLYFNKDRVVQDEQLSRFRDALIHRGPDFGANFIDKNLGLAHRRLSIIDLSNAANQPMFSSDGRFVLVYNGEIYNFRILREELIKLGHFFTTNSDTEVLLKLYQVYGEKMLPKLNGMFSFVVWDVQERELFAARGKAGIKPLYYVADGEQFLFASEAKAILRYGYPFDIEESGLNELLIFRFIAGNKTLFKGINKLESGYCLKIKEDSKLTIKRWWNLKEDIQNHPTIHNPQEWFTHTFNDAIKIHMISDVPVGVLLSGGLDSSSICASLFQQNFKDIHTFNVGFKNFADDESQYAEILSNHFNFPFHSIEVEDDELAENLSIANYIHDEPLIHQNEPQLVAISRFAKKFVTVLLSGEGADEFLGGYIRYRPIAYYKNRMLINTGLSLTPSIFKNERLRKLERYFKIANADEMLLYNAATIILRIF